MKLLFRIIGVFCVVYAIMLLIPIATPIFFPKNFTATLTATTYDLVSTAKSETASFSTTTSCSSASNRNPRTVCAESYPIRDFQIKTTSANCGSNVVAASPALDTEKRCLNLIETLRGCGEDRLLGIKVCKGRGWLKYTTTLTSETTNKIEVENFGPQTFEISTNGKTIPFGTKPFQFADWRVTISSPDKAEPVVELTDTQPSFGEFSTALRGNQMIIGYAASDAP